jgi:hypothetical protein
MNDKYPNPWNFSNIDKNLFSSEEGSKVEYGELFEIAMGGPLGADCYLVKGANKRIKISKWAGGPAIWNEIGNKVAFPIWTIDRSQKIRLIDLEANKVITFSKKFRVLDLEHFENEIIFGIDSPIYKPIEIKFDTSKENRETQKKLEAE